MIQYVTKLVTKLMTVPINTQYYTQEMLILASGLTNIWGFFL